MQEQRLEQLLIPVANSDRHEHVVVPLDNLPRDVEDVIDILKAEEAPISLWLDFAKAYLQHEGLEQYLYILRQIIGDEVLGHFGDGVKFERIQAHCALAQYHMVLARAEQDLNERNRLLNEANKHLTAVKREDHTDQLVHLTAGQLEITKGNLKMATIHLVRAQKSLCNGHTNVAGHIALAQLYYQQELFDKAIKCYQEALKMFPGGPISIRLGIAACHYRLRNVAQAEAAYNRVLELDPGNSEAMAGLAALQLSLSSSRQALSGGMDLVFRAFNQDPTSAPVLNTLATAALVRGEFAESKELAERALEMADTLQMKGTCYATLGRAHHAMGEVDQAQSCYAKANRLNDKLPLSHFGLAQMLIQRGEIKNAATELDTVLDMRPKEIDALMLLGHLHPYMPTKADKTVPRFREAARRHADDAGLQEMLGEVLAPSEPGKALEAYKRALQLHRERVSAAQDASPSRANGASELDANPAVPPRLLNNTAVLHHRVGMSHEALALFQEALTVVEARGVEADVSDAFITTLRYNLARCQESCGESQKACAAYKSILQEQPAFIDCYLRLASLARLKGDHKLAEKYTNDAMEMEGGHEDALVMMAANRIKQKAWKPAKELLTKLLKGVNGTGGSPNDVYGNVLSGNLSLASAPPIPAKATPAQVKAAQKLQLSHWHTALKYYKTALSVDPGNIYAANGLGAVCAEMGRLSAAREIFSLLRESASVAGSFMQLPDVWVNLGSIHVARGEPEDAARLYRTALERVHKKDSRLLLWLARALYDQGKLADAKRTLLRAIHIAPTDHQLLFNAAFTMQQFAIAVLRKKRDPGDPNKLQDLTAAKIELSQAAQFFERLMTLGKDRTGIPTDKLKSHTSFCHTTLAKAEQHYVSAKAEMEVLSMKRSKLQTNLQIAMEQRELKRVLAEEAEKMRVLEEELKAKEAITRARALQEKWRHADAMNTAVKSGDGDAAAKAIKKQKAQQRQQAVVEHDDLFGEDESDDEDYDEAALAQDEADAKLEEDALRDMGHDSDDERGTGGPDPFKPEPAAKHRIKRRRDQDTNQASLGLESDDDQDGAADVQLDTASPEPTKRSRTVLDSDEDA